MSLRYETESSDVESPEAASQQPTPFPVYTIILIASFVLVTLVQLATGLDHSILVAGFDKSAFRSGEYWRLLTGSALHGGVLHVLFNGYAFYSFGRIFEMLANRAHLAIVFLLAAIGGGVLSLILSPTGISVGASGGIVGLIGYLAVYAFKRKDFINPSFRRNLLTNIGFILIYGLVMYHTIDNFAHIGGLVTGAVYGLIQIPSDPYLDPREASGVTEAAGLASVGIYIAACVFAVLLILNIV